eukprot:3900655-Prymnesium_polylepis.1
MPFQILGDGKTYARATPPPAAKAEPKRRAEGTGEPPFSAPERGTRLEVAWLLESDGDGDADERGGRGGGARLVWWGATVVGHPLTAAE